MTKKQTAPRRKTAARRPKSATRVIPASGASATGPVTLAQARALAKVRPTTASMSARAATLATPLVSPASVGLERKKLEAKQDQERKKRLQEYKATLAIMKKRGVKGLGPKTPPAAGPRPAVRALKNASTPLQVFAEGDSWFDYPVPFFGGGIIQRLENAVGIPILNLAKAGDEVRYMLGVRERKILIKQLTNGCPAGGPWDAMLFSGGGNDIVDDPMALWIRDFNPALPPAALVHQGRFDAALALVRAGYEDVIGLRDRLSPQTHLFFHGYDFVIPDGRGVCFLGPWLEPAFALRGFPTQGAAFEVMKILLQQFASMLKTLAAAHARVTVVQTQGTLVPQKSSWHNELHPSKAGFNAFAALFRQALKAVFPTKVL